jgi:hypothetical protein
MFLDALHQLSDKESSGFHKLYYSPARLEYVRTEAGSDIRAWCENESTQPIQEVELEQEVEQATKSLAIFETNMAEITEDGSVDGKRGSAIFPIFSRINHSCVPNSTYYLAKSHVPRLEVRAIQNIKCGEQIYISYVENGLPREKRQQMLSGHWGFACSCEACKA